LVVVGGVVGGLEREDPRCSDAENFCKFLRLCTRRVGADVRGSLGSKKEKHGRAGTAQGRAAHLSTSPPGVPGEAACSGAGLFEPKAFVPAGRQRVHSPSSPAHGGNAKRRPAGLRKILEQVGAKKERTWRDRQRFGRWKAGSARAARPATTTPRPFHTTREAKSSFSFLLPRFVRFRPLSFLFVCC